MGDNRSNLRTKRLDNNRLTKASPEYNLNKSISQTVNMFNDHIKFFTYIETHTCHRSNKLRDKISLLKYNRAESIQKADCHFNHTHSWSGQPARYPG